jgi:alpha-beta hydrolase superfamily lysophospholipase
MFFSHGLGDHCGRYHEYATLWNNHSIAFFCLDHQGELLYPRHFFLLCLPQHLLSEMTGHGRSEGERVYVEDFDHFLADYNQFLDAVLQSHNLHHLPRFLTGCVPMHYTRAHTRAHALTDVM